MWGLGLDQILVPENKYVFMKITGALNQVQGTEIRSREQKPGPGNRNQVQGTETRTREQKPGPGNQVCLGPRGDLLRSSVSRRVRQLVSIIFSFIKAEK